MWTTKKGNFLLRQSFGQKQARPYNRIEEQMMFFQTMSTTNKGYYIECLR